MEHALPPEPAGNEIRRLQESIAFLERRLDEYASVTDDLADRLSLAVNRIAALESGADRLKHDLHQLKDADQSGPGQPA